MLEKWLSFLAGDEQTASQPEPDFPESDASSAPADAVQETYKQEQDRTLTDAVLDAIEEYKGTDLSHGDFPLFNDVDPNALDTIFKDDAEPGTTLSFTTDNVQVELWGDGWVEIHVS